MSVDTIINRLKKRIAYQNPKLDLTSGNVLSDLGVMANAEEFNTLEQNLARLKLLYLLDSTAFSDYEADMLANSLGLSRIAASKASSTLQICLLNVPASTVTYEAGGTVATVSTDGSQQVYVLTSSGTISNTTPFNPESGYYECTVGIQATAAGTEGNVGPGTITNITGLSAQADAVYNPNALTNGSNAETTEELLTRIKQHLAGIISGTVPYYEAKSAEDTRVTDLVVVDPDNAFSLRGPASIDIYIQGSQYATYTQTVTNRDQTVYLEKCPVVLGTATATITVDGTDITYTEGSGFVIVKDTTSFVATSVKSKDRLVWSSDLVDVIASLESDYTISYTYNYLVEDLQTQLTADDVKTIGADILVKETTPINVEMAFGIVTLPGTDPISVKQDVITTIEAFVNSLRLNTSLRQSDIINLIENTNGVDYLRDYDGKMFTKFCVVGQNKVTDLEGTPLSYYRIETENITVG